MKKEHTRSTTSLVKTNFYCGLLKIFRISSPKKVGSSLFALLLVFLFLQTAEAQGPGSAWQYYRVITLSPATPAANFQVKITLTSGQYTGMKSDGSDLRFYDDSGNNCSYWIESWNTSGTSVIWVKVTASGSDMLIMYYGNTSATATSSGDNTFDFFDDFTSALGSKWTTSGNVTQSGSNVTLSNTNGTTAATLSNSDAFTPSSSSFLLETKHYEVGYNRNRFYAATTVNGGSPISVGDYGYFSTSGTAQTSAQVFWGSFPGSTSVSNNTNYLTQWRITDGSTYNWYTYNYSTGVAVTNGSRTTTCSSTIRFFSVLVTEVGGTSSILDWVRLRQYTATEPTASVGNQYSNNNFTSPVVFSSSGYFIVPDDVTSITVECWGGGGRGGSTNGDAYGGGGGGGAYSSSVLTVSQGNTFNVTVGTGSTTTAAGGDSWFSSTSTVLAKGGNSGPTASGVQTGATGGAAGSGVGTIKYSGGNGANGNTSGTDYGGGGGSSAGTAANGTTATNQNGATAPAGGGNGGNGRYNTDGAGSAGSIPGGGGGGALRNGGTNYNGGNGADGQVRISWCVPPAAPSVTTPVTYCLNATAIPLTATGSNLLWYTTPTGGTGSPTAPTPSTASVGTTSYYVSQTVGCEGPRARIDVIVYTPVTSVSGQSNVSCYGGADGSITIQASGGTAPYQYSVDNGLTYTTGTNPNPYTYSGLSANIQYKIRVQDSNGCQSPAIP